MSKCFLYLDKESVDVTGGQKYNADFLGVLEQMNGCEIYYTPNVHEVYKRTPKILIPLIELKWIRKIRKMDYVFFGDTSYFYHFLLLLLTRIITRARCLLIVHHYSFMGERNGFNFRGFFERKYSSLMHNIIYPNPYVLDKAKGYFPNKELFYIPTHIKRNTIQDVSPTLNEVLFVGTIEHRKGIHHLVNSFDIVVSKIPTAKLTLVGKIANEAYYQEILKIIREKGLIENVEFAGRVSEEKLDELFRYAYVFAFPSLLEGYGLSIVEAMQYGIPVVAFNNSAMPYTIKDGINGFLIDNEDYEAFAYKLIEILDEPDLRERLSKGAYSTINNIADYNEFKSILIDYINNLK